MQSKVKNYWILWIPKPRPKPWAPPPPPGPTQTPPFTWRLPPPPTNTKLGPRSRRLLAVRRAQRGRWFSTHRKEENMRLGLCFNPPCFAETGGTHNSTPRRRTWRERYQPIDVSSCKLNSSTIFLLIGVRRARAGIRSCVLMPYCLLVELAQRTRH